MKTLVLASASALAMLLGTSAHAAVQLSPVIICDDPDSCDVTSDPGSDPTPPTKPVVTTPTAPAVTMTTTIGFTNVGQSLSTVGGTYTEGGYTFTTTSGAYSYTTYGAGGPSAVFVLGPLAVGFDPNAPANLLSFGRTDGGLFTFDNFQSVRGSAAGVNTIGITGYLAGVQIGNTTLTSTYDGYFQPIGTGLVQPFDRVVINYSTTSSSASLDQLVVTSTPAAAAVPEPASWAMMVGGFGLVGGAVRRRARTAKIA